MKENESHPAERERLRRVERAPPARGRVAAPRRRSISLLGLFDHNVVDVRLGEITLRVTGKCDAHPRRLREAGDGIFTGRTQVSRGRVAQVDPGLAVVLRVEALERIALAD